MHQSLAHPTRSLSRIVVSLAITTLLAACGTAPSRPPTASEARPAPGTVPAPGVARPGGYYLDDGPDAAPPQDLDSIPDATPRAEPLHRFANRPYEVMGQSFRPLNAVQPYKASGIASWYGKKFHGRRTASGEVYDMYAMTAAHPTLPIPSYARVTNVANGRAVVVRINDRGPFLKSRLIDLSYAAANRLGYISRGHADVIVESIIPEELNMVARTAPASPGTAPSAPGPLVRAEPVYAADASAAPQPPLASGLYLQLGAFAERRNAESFRDYISVELGPLNEKIHLVSDPERHRLHLGPYASADAARKVADQIADRLKFKPFIVRQ